MWRALNWSGNTLVKLACCSKYQHILAINDIPQSILSDLNLQEGERILTVVCVMHLTVNN